MKNNNWKEKVKVFVQGLFSSSSKSFVEQILDDEEEELRPNSSEDYKSEDKVTMGGNIYADNTTDIQGSLISENSFTTALSEAVADAIRENSKLESANCSDFVNPITQDITIDVSDRESISEDCSTSDVKMFFMDLSVLIDELDAVLIKESLPNIMETIKYTQDRIIEIMIKNGGVVISTECGFDIAKHRPIPFKMVEQGRKINNVVRPGVTYNGTTIVKALVET